MSAADELPSSPTPVGFGCGARVQDVAVFEAALRAGFRTFDTAVTYGNDAKILSGELGSEFRKNRREELYLITKVQPHQEITRECTIAVRERMSLDYVDLLLLHFPFDLSLPGRNPVARLRECWKEMEQLVRAGIAKSIGISNAGIPALSYLLGISDIRPAVNQIESHPYLPQSALVAWCIDHGIAVQACCPLASPWRGSPDGRRLFDEPCVLRIAARLARHPAQVCLRWHVQRNVVPIVSTFRQEHMDANLRLFDFRLEPAEMAEIERLDKGLRFINGPPHLAGLFGRIESDRLVLPGMVAQQPHP